MKNWFYLKLDGQRRNGALLLWFLVLNAATPFEIVSMIFRPARFFGRGFFSRWMLVVAIAVLFASGAEAAEFTKQPYLQHVTKTSIIICWETDKPATSTIRFGVTKNPGESATIPNPDTFTEARIQNLSPGTEYFFEVNADGEIYRGRFKTAPETGTPYRAIVYGDFRTGPVETTMVRKMISEKPDIVVTVGDYMHDGRKAELWPPLFQTIGPLIRRIPYYVSLGNHEENSPLYFKYFAMPGNERWYSFDYGSVHYIALDSNEPYRTEPSQTKWLENDLAAARGNPETQFVFVFFHHPPYGTGERHGDPQIAELWTPIFEKYKVDAVFAGHEHFYERCVVNGIPYIVTGGGGARLYEFKYEEPYSVVRASRYQYTALDVGVDSVKVKSVALEGDTIDEFEIRKK